MLDIGAYLEFIRNNEHKEFKRIINYQIQSKNAFERLSTNQINQTLQQHFFEIVFVNVLVAFNEFVEFFCKIEAIMDPIFVEVRDRLFNFDDIVLKTKMMKSLFESILYGSKPEDFIPNLDKECAFLKFARSLSKNIRPWVDNNPIDQIFSFRFCIAFTLCVQIPELSDFKSTIFGILNSHNCEFVSKLDKCFTTFYSCLENFYKITIDMVEDLKLNPLCIYNLSPSKRWGLVHDLISVTTKRKCLLYQTLRATKPPAHCTLGKAMETIILGQQNDKKPIENATEPLNPPNHMYLK